MHSVWACTRVGCRFVKMGVMLLNEQRLGDKSRLAAYVEQLPASYDSPVLWEDAQLEQLQYPALIAAVGGVGCVCNKQAAIVIGSTAVSSPPTLHSKQPHARACAGTAAA